MWFNCVKEWRIPSMRGRVIATSRSFGALKSTSFVVWLKTPHVAPAAQFRGGTGAHVAPKLDHGIFSVHFALICRIALRVAHEKVKINADCGEIKPRQKSLVLLTAASTTSPGSRVRHVTIR
jgi:hypothetical protein